MQEEPGKNTTKDLILYFIEKFSKEHGYPPTIREIAIGTDIASTSTVAYHLRQLDKEGRIVYAPGKARSISVIGLARPRTNLEDLAEKTSAAVQSFGALCDLASTLAAIQSMPAMDAQGWLEHLIQNTKEEQT